MVPEAPMFKGIGQFSFAMVEKSEAVDAAPVRSGDRVGPPDVLEVRDEEAGELVRVGGQAEEAAKTQRDLVERGELPADIVSRHLVDDDGAAVRLAGGGLHVGKAHAVIAVRLDVDGTLASMGIGDERRQPLARL